MTIWVISDTHFNHANIIRYCGRSFTNVDQMNDTMIRRWNSCVREGDLVLHLGDFALHKDSSSVRAICKQLHGRKILVKGNHDRKSMTWYINNGFEFFCDSFVLGDILFTHRPVPKSLFIQMQIPYRLNVHGHIHQKETLDPLMYKNVSVEKLNYFPIHLDSILNEFKITLRRNR
jgi:calcineurin-like phosphoesterase family protein